MSKLGYCVPCGEEHRDVDAVMMVDDDPMCVMHARVNGVSQEHLAQLKPEPYPRRGEAQKAEQRSPKPTVASSTLATPAKIKIEIKLCRRCNQPCHKGRCKGVPTVFGAISRRLGAAGYTAAPIDLPPVMVIPKANAPTAQKRGPYTAPETVDRVKIADIPKVLVYRKPQGKMGKYWAELEVLPEGEAIRVTSEDHKRAGTLVSQFQAKARDMGRKLEYRRDGVTVYAWLVAPDGV